MRHGAVAHGIRKVSEFNVSKNRGLVFIEETEGDVRFNEVPYGAVKINPYTGQMYVKQEGQSDWVICGLRWSDGTDNIQKDTPVIVERFFITEAKSNSDTFRCYRRIPKLDENGWATEEFEDEYRTFKRINGGFLFELEYGTYTPGRNHVSVQLDDLLFRDAATGGVVEYSEREVLVTDFLWENSEVTIKYLGYTRPGIVYPRLWNQKEEPTQANVGDLWIDQNASLEDNMILGKLGDKYAAVPWSMLNGKSSQAKGYGLERAVAFKNHSHEVHELEDFQSSIQQTIRDYQDRLNELFVKLSEKTGEQGDDGVAPTIEIYSDVTNLNGEIAKVENVDGDSRHLKLRFTYAHGPKGLDGDKGPDGDVGAQGPPGRDGVDGRDGIDRTTEAVDMTPSALTANLHNMPRADLENFLALPIGFSAAYTDDQSTLWGYDRCNMLIIKPDKGWGTFFAIPRYSGEVEGSGKTVETPAHNHLYRGYFDTDKIIYVQHDTVK